MLLIGHGLAGVIVSFVIGIPLGPVNLLLIQMAIDRRRGTALRMAAGSAVAEFVYCYIAVLGVNLFLGHQENVLNVLQIASVPVLLFLAWRNFRPLPKQEPRMYKRSNAFVTGLLLNIMNAGLLPLWLGVSSLLSAKFGWFGNNAFNLTVYAVGVMIGTMLLHLCVIVLSGTARRQLPDSARLVINRIIGMLFFSLAGYQVYSLFV